ncbi:hypothetical protein KY366_02835 [Candidatus Woesearchaeota archaeon]|nr:hypothetical protein [Candidatus Woesearchaeota archaeon]
MAKKGQIPGQIFIYLIALILFSLILLYGYNSIRGFKEKSEQVSYIKFKTDLTSMVKRVSPDYNTLKREKLFIGGDYTEVCFVQSYKKEDNFDFIRTHIGNLIIQDSFESRVDKNVFLFKKGIAESFDVGNINVTGGSVCIPVISGKARIEFKGMGDHVFISGW